MSEQTSFWFPTLSTMLYEYMPIEVKPLLSLPKERAMQWHFSDLVLIFKNYNLSMSEQSSF